LKVLHRFALALGLGVVAFALVALVYLSGGPKPPGGGNQSGDDGNIAYEPKLREAAVAGSFYPDDPLELKQTVDSYLGDAEGVCSGEEIGGLIVPHAGYVYSGPIAAWAYKQLENRTYDTVVLVGPSHYQAVSKASVYPCGWYRTPLGDVEIDEGISMSLIGTSADISYQPEAHDQEHSLEVQLPFLQETLGSFKIVAIAINDYDPALWTRVADAVADCCKGRKVLLVASSDLSHYHPRSDAIILDQAVVSSVDGCDPVGLQFKARSGACELCGLAAVETVMLACERMGYNASVILRYGDSGSYSGDISSVVGYLSAALTRGKTSSALGAESRQELLRLARSSIAHYLETGQTLDYQTTDPSLLERGGAFVTLKKHGTLRGCIGYTLPEYPLWLAVREVAVKAACEDPRFPALTVDELKDVEIEVSVLSRLKLVLSPGEIQIGRDGLYIVGYGTAGLLLPQVPVENGWDRQRYLAEICNKAGLASDAWETSELYSFTAQVFGE